MQQDSGKRLLQWNIIVSMLSQVLSLVINLISKRVICLYLNVEYLGLQSLYSNFCDVLSFAYFGAGTAMLFSYYGPLARGDKERLATIYRHYDGIYKKMTCVVLGIGSISTIFAVFSVNASISDLEVAVTYLTFMLSVVLYNRQMVRNYFIQADQRRYFVAAVTGGVDASALIIEILLLKYFKSYEAFVVCILVKNILINWIFGKYLKIRYGYLFKRGSGLEKEEADTIKSNVSDMVMYRFGKVLISNTDNIFISRFISTAMVGIYSNYQFIIAGITSLIAAFYEAITARVGQMLSMSERENQYQGFQFYSFINSWMAGATIVCFYYLVQDFIRIWMGSVDLLSREVIIVIIVNYYLEICRSATKMYRESAGLFKNIKRMILINRSFLCTGKNMGAVGNFNCNDYCIGCHAFLVRTPHCIPVFKKKLYERNLLSVHHASADGSIPPCYRAGRRGASGRRSPALHLESRCVRSGMQSLLSGILLYL